MCINTEKLKHGVIPQIVIECIMPCADHARLLMLFFFFYSSGDVEICVNWSESTTQQVDLAFNIFFMIYFFIRVSETIICYTIFLRNLLTEILFRL